VRKATCIQRSRPADMLREIRACEAGAVLVEAAIAIPIMIALLLGIVTYASWFMAAHSLQEAANDAARSALAGLNAVERKMLVDRSLERGVLSAGTIAPDLLSVETETDGSFYKVALTYDVEKSGIFQNSFVPLPSGSIRREALIELSSL
jgi:Flp pilus assembly protein TadG